MREHRAGTQCQETYPMKVILRNIASHLVGMAWADLSTAETNIAMALVEAGFLAAPMRGHSPGVVQWGAA
jgi:hypothetical protein